MKIKTVVRTERDRVMVFDTRGEQITRYQGKYDKVRESILKDAPAEAIFAYGYTSNGEIRTLPREEW